MDTMDQLDKLLGIDPAETLSAQNDEALVVATDTDVANDTQSSADAPLVKGEVVLGQDTSEIEDDFQFARTGIRDMVAKARNALDAAILLAQAGDSPRAYEVVGKLLENITNANRELIDLHRAKKDITKAPAQSLLPTEQSGSGNISIEKAVFVGRASDLLREIHAQRKRIEKEQDETEQTPAE